MIREFLFGLLGLASIVISIAGVVLLAQAAVDCTTDLDCMMKYGELE